jgi:hypothetical protein
MKPEKEIKSDCKAQKIKLRRLVDDILRADEKPTTFDGLATRVAEILRAEDERWKRRTLLEDATFRCPQSDPMLTDDETTLLEEIYWDLFREKIITFSHNDTAYFSIHSEAPKI